MMVSDESAGQLTLPIERAHEQTLETFVAGPNEEIVAAMAKPGEAFTGIWLCGGEGSGKTHLLRALALQDGHPERRLYIDANGLRARDHLDLAASQGEVILIDEPSRFAGQRQSEEALMTIYERVRGARGMLVVADRLAARATEFGIADLNSRLRSLMHFQMRPLQDGDKADILRGRAARRGYVLSDAVLDYWLARGPRDLRLLLTDLDRLDRASLVHHRHVTVPLLKEVLGY